MQASGTWLTYHLAFGLPLQLVPTRAATVPDIQGNVITSLDIFVWAHVYIPGPSRTRRAVRAGNGRAGVSGGGPGGGRGGWWHLSKRTHFRQSLPSCSLYLPNSFLSRGILMLIFQRRRETPKPCVSPTVPHTAPGALRGVP